MTSQGFNRWHEAMPGYKCISRGKDASGHISVSVYIPHDQMAVKIIDEGTALLLASTSHDKLMQNTRALQNYPVESFYVTDIFGAVKDSMEEESNAFDICDNKLMESIEHEWRPMDERTKAAVLSRMGVEKEDDVIIYSEDRGMAFDLTAEQMEAVKNHSIWDVIRDQPLVDQVFVEGAIFPDFRLKEVEQLCGGTINFLDMMNSCLSDLGIEDTTQKSRIVYAFRRGLSGIGPVYYVEAVENARTLRPVTGADRRREQEDQNFDLDYLQKPAAALGNPDQHSIRDLWENNDSYGAHYWNDGSLAALSISALMRVQDITRLAEPKRPKYLMLPDYQLVSNRDIGFGTDNPINSLADLENMRFLGNGYRLQAPKLVGLSPEMALLKRLELRLFASYLATMKPLGDKYIKDRPMIVDNDVLLNELRDLVTASKYKTTHGRLVDFMKVAHSKAQVFDLLKTGWCEDKIVENPSVMPTVPLDTWDDLQAVTGVERTQHDFRVGLIGASSSPQIQANEDAKRLSYLLAIAGLGLNDGGGTRHIMLKFLLGHYQAWQENAELVGQHFSTRTPEVSRKEGVFEDLFTSMDIADDQVRRKDAHYLRYLNYGHVMERATLGARQHTILGASDVVCTALGGAGTAYEYYAVMVHNLMVTITGKGLFPGLNNEEQIPVIYLNSRVRGNRGNVGFFDPVLASLTPQEKEMACVKGGDSPDAVAQECFLLAEKRMPHIRWSVPRPQ